MSEQQVGGSVNTAPEGPARRFMRNLWYEWIRPLILIGLVLGSLRSALADWNDVPTGSMKPTILEGDRVFVNKLAYDLKVPFTLWRLAEWDNPKRGDIIVFFSPEDGKRLVKRVIGIPGDEVELRRGHLLINGQPADYQPIAQEVIAALDVDDADEFIFVQETVENSVAHPIMIEEQPRFAIRDFGPTTVPDGRYFAMGDNRDQSFDSRFFGFVDRHSIVGRVVAVVVSVDRNDWYMPRWDRFFHKLL